MNINITAYALPSCQPTHITIIANPTQSADSTQHTKPEHVKPLSSVLGLNFLRIPDHTTYYNHIIQTNIKLSHSEITIWSVVNHLIKSSTYILQHVNPFNTSAAILNNQCYHSTQHNSLVKLQFRLVHLILDKNLNTQSLLQHITSKNTSNVFT
jgi:hypothetical protein